MPSNPISLVPGAHLGDYALFEPIGSSPDLWRAEDARTGGPVALKVLSRSLSGNAGRRQELIRQLQQAAAFRHPHVVSIRDIGADGDLLYLTMEVVEGEPLSRIVRRGLPDRKQYFRLGYELISSLQYLHARPLIHGNVGGETVLLTRSGSVKLVGFSLANLMNEGGPERARRRLLDPNAVAYMSPEAIAGTPLDARSDIFSFGCVMYEALTGRTPFAGASAADIAAAILNGQPVSPKKVRAGVDPDAVAIIGLCLFTDPDRRPATADEVRAAILKVAPELAAIKLPASSDVARPVARVNPLLDLPIRAADLLRQAKTVEPVPGPGSEASASPVPSTSRDGVIWAAELANFPELELDDRSRAWKAASRMHQILGEAAHLFDGTVSDSSGPRMVAEMPDASRAYQAGRKGEQDLAEIFDDLEPKPLVRMVLHAGTLDPPGDSITRDAVEEVADTLTSVPPGHLFMTEQFLSRSGGVLKTERVPGVPGLLYSGVPHPQGVADSAAPDTSGANATIAIRPAKRKIEKDPAELTTIVQPVRSKRWLFIASGALLALLAAGAWLATHRDRDVSAVPASDEEVLPTAAHPHTIALAALTSDPGEVVLSDRAVKARATAVEILRAAPQLRLAAVTAEADVFGGHVQRTSSGDQIVPLHRTGKRRIGEAAPFGDAATGAQSLVTWICAQLRVPPPPMTASVPALGSFADAVGAYTDHKPAAEVDRSLKASLAADPTFVPGEMFAMRLYNEWGDLRRAADSARQLLALDPGNVAALETMARTTSAAGDAVSSIGYWNLSLQNDPGNIAAINALGHFAVAANDPVVFERALRRLRDAGAGRLAELHEPDLLVATGRIDAAVGKYYDIEVKERANAALALKIGRIAVLRHSAAIADIELKKLATLDPDYSRHLLAAYIAAQARQKEKAESELRLAGQSSVTRGDLYTSAAEIAAMTADTRGVVTNLGKALKASEPTASYVLSNPLFGYLRSDAGFRSVRESIVAQQNAIKAALQHVKL